MQQDSSHPTGVAPSEGEKENAPGLVRARERKANAALQLKVAGADWDEIAEVLGFPTARQALVAVEGALEKELRETSTKHVRALASRRLESLLRATWLKATDPEHPEQLTAVARAQAITMDWAKLHGAIAPTEHIVHSPSQAELDAWVAQVVGHDVPQLEEADIFDADVVEPEDESVPAT